MLIDLALVLDNASITVSPRDGVSRSWLIHGGQAHLAVPLEVIRRRWTNEFISKGSLTTIAAYLESECNAYMGRIQSGYPFPGGSDRWAVTIRIRACEYRPVVQYEELVEL